MPLYLAVPLVPDSDALSAAIETNMAAPDRYKLQSDAGWLLKFDGTTAELSNHIGLTGQPKGQSSPIVRHWLFQSRVTTVAAPLICGNG